MFCSILFTVLQKPDWVPTAHLQYASYQATRLYLSLYNVYVVFVIYTVLRSLTGVRMSEVQIPGDRTTIVRIGLMPEWPGI